MRKRSYNNKDITKEHVLHELGCIAFANAADYTDFENDIIKTDLKRDETAAVSEIIQSKDGIKLKFYDKMKALDMISKQMGFYDCPDNAETDKNGVVIIPETDTEES